MTVGRDALGRTPLGRAAVRPDVGGVQAVSAVIRPERALERLEVWTDVEAAGGERLSVFPDQAIDACVETRTLTEHKLEVEARRDLDAWDALQPERVIRTVYTDDAVAEWRVRQPVEAHRVRDGELKGRIRAESILYDLLSNSALVERVEANGDASGVFPLSLTIAGHMQNVLQYAPDYFAAGTIDPADTFTYEYRWDPPLRVLRDLADRAGAELDWTRKADGTYEVDVVDRVGAGAEKSHLAVRRNLLDVEHEADSRDQATRLVPIGSGPDVRPADISDNSWEVSSVSGSEVFLAGAPVGFDGQLDGMGAYLEKPDGSTTEVTASDKSAQSVTVADASGILAGDRVRFVRNAAGDDLTFLEDPSAVNEFGVKADTHERNDIPAVNNLLANGFLSDWSGGQPVSWDPVGSPTLSETNAAARTQYGDAAAHVTAAEGEGLETDLIGINPSSERPFYSGHARFYLQSGQVRVVVVDVTNGEVWPKPDAEEEGVAASLGWNDNFKVQAPEDFAERGTAELRLRIVAHGGPAEFYLDAAGVVHSQAAPDTFYEGFASNALWESANRELLTRSLPSHSYRASLFDLERFDPEGFPHDRLLVGADVQVRDATLGLDFSTRVVEVRRDWSESSATELKLSSRRLDMAGLLGSTASRAARARQPARSSPVPGDVDASSIQYTFTDSVEVRWDDVPNAATYLLRWAPAGSNTSWGNATPLPSVQEDAAVIPRDTVVNVIGARSFDLLIKGRNENGVESRSAATVTVSNPAPDASVIDPSADWTSSHEGSAIRVEVDVTGAEASRIRLYGSDTSGFAPGEGNFVAERVIEEGQTVVGFQFKVPESIAPVSEGDDAYFRAEVSDRLTHPLNESPSLSAEATVTVGLETATQPPQWGVHLKKSEATDGTVEGTVSISFVDLQGRASGGAFDKSPLGGGNWDPARPPDATWDQVDTVAAGNTFTTTHGPFTVHDKHPREILVAFRWQDAAGVHHWQYQPVTFDTDRVPEGRILGVGFQTDGTPEVSLGWDDDLDHFRFTFNVGDVGAVTEPADPTTGDSRFPASGSITHGRLVLSTTVEEGQSLWIKLAGVRPDGTIATKDRHILEARTPRSGSKQQPTVEFDTNDPTADDDQVDVIIDAVAGKGGDAASLQIEYQLYDLTNAQWGATQGPFTDPHTVSNVGTNTPLRARARDTSLPAGEQTGEWKYMASHLTFFVPESGEDLPRTSTDSNTLDEYTQDLRSDGSADTGFGQYDGAFNLKPGTGLEPGGAQDGEGITFGVNRNDAPNVDFFPTGGLFNVDGTGNVDASKQYGPSYQAANKSASGFTADLKIQETAGSTTTQTISSWSTGSTQDFEANKSSSAEAWDDKYTLQVHLFIAGNSFGGDCFGSSADLEWYYNKGSGWVLENTTSHQSGCNDFDQDVSYSMTVDGMGSGSDFGVTHVGGGSMSQPSTGPAVEWETATQPAEESATPSGASDIGWLAQKA